MGTLCTGYRGVRVGGVTSRTSFLASVALSRGVVVEILPDEEPFLRHVQRHVVPRIAGVESHKLLPVS